MLLFLGGFGFAATLPLKTIMFPFCFGITEVWDFGDPEEDLESTEIDLSISGSMIGAVGLISSVVELEVVWGLGSRATDLSIDESVTKLESLGRWSSSAFVSFVVSVLSDCLVLSTTASVTFSSDLTLVTPVRVAISGVLSATWGIPCIAGKFVA